MAIISVLPNNLTNGTTADATQVMANFNQIVNNVNANAAPLTNTALLNASNSFTMVQIGVNATGAANFPTASQVQNNMAMGSDVGSPNAYIINPIVPVSAYTNGQIFTVFGTQAMNGGNATLQVSGLAANQILNPDGSVLSSAQFPKSCSFSVIADATNNKFRLPPPTTSQGTSTLTLTGCTTAPTVTAVWSITNNVVTLFIPAVTATSNTTGATLTGLSAAITPATTHSQITVTTTDNGSSLLSSVDVTNTGVITLRVGANSSAVFTNSGTKGIAGGLTITYNLN